MRKAKQEVALLKEEGDQVEMFPTKENEVANLLTIAIEKGAGIEQLSSLLDLQMRMNREQARREFIRAVSLFQSKVKPVVKTATVKYTSAKGTTNFSFAKLSDIIQSITPTLAECGLSVRWMSEEAAGVITVTCIVSHVGGHSEQAAMSGEPDTSGGKNNIQAKGSTMTYLQRYTLNLALAICTEDDNDGAGGAPPTKPQPNASQLETMREKLRSGSVTIERIRDHFTLSQDQVNYLNETK